MKVHVMPPSKLPTTMTEAELIRLANRLSESIHKRQDEWAREFYRREAELHAQIEEELLLHPWFRL